MKKVNVIMSSYNGERYIVEQLDSLLQQTYKNIDIFIRDDGSTDKTMDIIKEYKEKLDNINNPIRIKLIDNEGKNLGYPKCFYEILRKCNNADYYFFCDQDDVWLPNKIELVVKRLERENNVLPLLCFSAFDYCDCNLNLVKHSTQINKKIEYKDVIYDLLEAFGFSIAFNNVTKELALKNLPVTTGRKDWWFIMIAAGLGKVVHEPKYLAKYRRHESAVTYFNTTENLLNGLLRRIKMFIFNDSISTIGNSLVEFKEKFASELSEENIKTINLFTDYNCMRLKKVFYLKRLRLKLKDEIAIRIVFLLKG